MNEQFTKVPNTAFGWIRAMTGADIKVYWVIVRKTVGFQKEKDGIPISQFMIQTGLGDKQIRNSIKKLELYGFIRVFRSKRRISVFVPLEPPKYSAGLHDFIESDPFGEIESGETE